LSGYDSPSDTGTARFEPEEAGEKNEESEKIVSIIHRTNTQWTAIKLRQLTQNSMG
jgi:hypothetical protein